MSTSDIKVEAYTPYRGQYRRTKLLGKTIRVLLQAIWAAGAKTFFVCEYIVSQKEEASVTTYYK